MAILHYEIMRDSSVKQAKRTHGWPKTVDKAFQTLRKTSSSPYDVLTNLECQYIADIFDVEVFKQLDCEERVADNCSAKTGEYISVFRRHAGASNLYTLDVLYEHLNSARVSPKIYRICDDKIRCWRCGQELGQIWAS